MLQLWGLKRIKPIKIAFEDNRQQNQYAIEQIKLALIEKAWLAIVGDESWSEQTAVNC